MNSETKQLFRLVLWSKLPSNLLSSSEKVFFALKIGSKTDFLAAIREEFSKFNSEDVISVLDAHSSVIRYVSVIMPRLDRSCFNSVDFNYRCDELLAELYQNDVFYPEKIQMKWRMIVRNFVEINGVRVCKREKELKNIKILNF